MRGSALVALLPCWCGGGIELWSCRATVFVMGRMSLGWIKDFLEGLSGV